MMIPFAPKRVDRVSHRWRRRFRSGVLVIVFFLAALSCERSDFLQTSEDQAETEMCGNPEHARRQNKNELVFCTADWCDACRRLDREVIDTNEFRELQDSYRFVLTRKECENQPETKDEPLTYPFLYFRKQETNEIVFRISGYRSKSHFLLDLKRNLVLAMDDSRKGPN